MLPYEQKEMHLFGEKEANVSVNDDHCVTDIHSYMHMWKEKNINLN